MDSGNAVGVFFIANGCCKESKFVEYDAVSLFVGFYVPCECEESRDTLYYMYGRYAVVECKFFVDHYYARKCVSVFDIDIFDSID